MGALMLAASTGYPLLDVFLTILWVFLFVAWIFVLVMVILDLFRSDDLSGWGKAGWLLAILVFEVFGVLAYLIVRGRGMSGRADRRAEAQRDKSQAETAGTAGSSDSTADQLAKLADLRDRGALSQQEFEQQKNKVLVGEAAEGLEAQPA